MRRHASADDARILYELPLALYEQLFAERSRSCCMWCRGRPGHLVGRALTDAAAMKALKVRHYDENGTSVLRDRAKAPRSSSSRSRSENEAGEINAVLSSGDAARGAKCGNSMRHFSDINTRAVELRVDLAVRMGKPRTMRDAAAMAEAARETTERQGPCWRHDRENVARRTAIRRHDHANRPPP